MAKIKEITIENYRSIGEEPVTIKFPSNIPITLVGENNVGKTNIIRAIELLFGEFHPKYRKLEDFEFFNRNPANKISICTSVSGFETRLGRSGEFSCGGFNYSNSKGSETHYAAIQLEDGNENQYVSNNLREELLCVNVDSVQNLSHQLSYASKYTLLSKVTKAFHDKLREDEDKVSRLKSLFQETKSIFFEVEEFREFSESMSTISGQMMSNMTHALEFDFSSYDPSNYFKNLNVQPNENGEVRALDELGTGQQQILALSFAKAYSDNFLGQGMILILDEPETHLHPIAQKWLAQKMEELAASGIQIIITTHSPHFINVEYLPGLYIVSKTNQTSVRNIDAEDFAEYCKNTGATRANSETILPFYSAHSKSHILNGFFAKKTILVEGETEELALPVLLNGTGLDVLKEGIAVIGVSGKGNLAKWWRLFTSLDIPTFVCFDNDQNDDSRGMKRKDALKAIGIADNIIEDALSADDWNINEKYCVFGNEYESTMRNTFSKYSEFEEIQKSLLGNSKPIIARAVANDLLQNEHIDEEWSHLRILAQKISELK